MDPGLKLEPVHYSLFNWTYSSSGNYTKDIFEETSIENQPSSISPLGVITATLVGFILSSRGSVHKVTHVVKCLDILEWISGVLLLIVVIPIYAVLLLYRYFFICIMKMKSSTFISLMEGSDAVWNMKDPSEPIITTLIEIETNYGADCLLRDIREAILKTILSNPKLSWNRNYSCMGFSFWEMCTDVASLNEHVMWLNASKKDKPYITSYELQYLISDISGNGLTKNQSCWEILVSQQYLQSERGDFQTKRYPVLLRIHHSLGDGVSLLNILLKHMSTFPDKEHQIYTSNSSADFHFEENQGSRNIARKTQDHKVEKQLKQSIKEIRNLREHKRGVIELFISDGKIIFLGDKIYHANTKRSPLSALQILLQYSSIFAIGKDIIKRSYLLLSSLNVVRKTCEISILDSNKLSGKKIVAWYNDSSQGSLFSSIKHIKSQNTDVRFTDVLLTVFSSSIEKYLKRRHQNIPKCISVVVPVYPSLINYSRTMENQTDGHKKCTSFSQDYVHENVKLQNSLSLGILNLPINIQGKVPRMHQVSRNMNMMHKSGQIAFNSFILKCVAKFLPHQLLNIIFNNVTHTTVVMSNLIGPTHDVLFAGYPMKNICFWVPHRRDTGISVSILSYCNRLQLGLMADTSIISSVDEVQNILDDIVSEVMHQVDKIIQDG